ncbi:hypothetical protein FRACYDRAFT_250204 [Fragilariopsis cylindrus CCMP1102]|uniref:Uncharacterized protein n=1 Tax=Fragilariopsis cylindrus CCMP1102 TaxID=635003 RepID=A0A1E7EQ43_9STRA|nr:hypothetical protein FRACYDRAFT_250204 [Fragilariopsis cylindrus CCMP1102]|eukprot:OEU07984.1 hypothetical protein FRACYDRAFT_250204 [Fragilariopsis cylindrus CCMP1102]
MPISLKQKNMEGEYYPPQLLSQKLNNRAAYCITITKNYEEAIKLLTKALKLTETNEEHKNDDYATGGNNAKPRCNCKDCSLESCLIMEQDEFMSLLRMDQTTQTTQTQQDQQQQHSQHSHDEHHQDGYNPSKKIKKETFDLDDGNDDEGFVYGRPLLVNKVCIDEMHNMGITLSLIILFNLALAHHLKAISIPFTVHSSKSKISSSSSTTVTQNAKSKLQVLQQALQLYELAYQLRVDYIQQSQQDELLSISNHDNDNDNDNDMDISNSADEVYNQSMIGSLRFTMIVSNNLGEIHRAAGNTEKHTMCLQHLLSAMMYMVDSDLLVLESSSMNGFYSNVAPIMGLKKKGVFAQAA